VFTGEVNISIIRFVFEFCNGFLGFEEKDGILLNYWDDYC